MNNQCDTEEQSQVPEAEVFWQALRQVIDPEVGMNIVELGLIYRLALGVQTLEVDMTMTSPACPMGEALLEDVEAALKKALPAGWALDLALVWEPPWSPERMSEEARAHFGWDE